MDKWMGHFDLWQVKIIFGTHSKAIAPDMMAEWKGGSDIKQLNNLTRAEMIKTTALMQASSPFYLEAQFSNLYLLQKLR